jgi:hypothetical protein
MKNTLKLGLYIFVWLSALLNSVHAAIDPGT